MSCLSCLCLFCARNCELSPEYTMIGEVEDYCFNCDACIAYDFNPQKHDKRKTNNPAYHLNCPAYQEAEKVTLRKAEIAEKRRMQIKIV